MQRVYTHLYPEIKLKINLIPNGFDEADFPDNFPAMDNQDMTVLHCGRFSVSGRNPGLLFHSLKTLTAQGYRLKLHLLGEENDIIQQQVIDLGLEKSVTMTGALPHEEAIAHMYRSVVLLIYQENSTTAQVSAVAGKTYEYLRVGKPLLVITPPGDNLNIVKQYAPRYEAVTDSTEATLIKAISTLYAEWKKGLLPTGSMPREAYIENYNRRSLSKKLAQIFDSLTH